MQFNSNIQAFLNYNTNIGRINSNTSIGAIRLDERGDYTLDRGRGLSGLQNNLGWAQVVSNQDQEKTTITDVGYVITGDLNWEDKIALFLRYSL